MLLTFLLKVNFNQQDKIFFINNLTCLQYFRRKHKTAKSPL